jgi:pSer/pThr/pTyr-binding forkhead associated (FHA) protein
MMRARLVRYSGGQIERQYMLEPVATTIGRDVGNAVQIVNPNVSKQHAVIRDKGGRWEIEDAGSKNGVFVNGRRVKKTARLNHGDTLALGSLEFAFEVSASPEEWTPDRVIDPTRRSTDMTLDDYQVKKPKKKGLFGR